MSQTFEKFGNYILLEKLQTGGMAEIYLARKPGASGVSRFVAIKRILPQFSESIEFIDMFKDEAKIAVQLTHANIVTIHEFGVEKNQFFLAMDYVEGRNLRQILNKMKKSGVSFSIEQVLYVIKEVAGGLDHAHRCIDTNTGKPLNIIHRDMSPQNIMVSFEGETKVVDFGIAKAETQLDTTRAGTLKGKFGYMSPEQAEGQNVDLRTDVFALGIVLWELLANDRLFVANNEINTLRKVRDCQIPSLRKINPNIPPELERIVSKALAKDRNLRYQTAAALNRELSRFLNRQFPDFSPHDFSVFIKTLFAAEILESRKKMVEYSKIQMPADKAAIPAPRPVADQTQITDPSVAGFNETFTENTMDHTPDFTNAKRESARQPVATPVATPARKQPPPPPQRQQQPNDLPPLRNDREPRQVIVAGENLNTSTLRVDRTSFREREAMRSEGTFAGGTHYGTRSHSQISVRSSGFKFSTALPLLIILIALSVGGGAVYAPKTVNSYLAQVPILRQFIPQKTGGLIDAPFNETVTASTCAKFDVVVMSTPSGAEILVGDKPQSDTTPTTLQICRDESIKLSIRMPGHLPVEQMIRVDSSKSLNYVLQPEKMAKLDITVNGSGQIYVDGKLVGRGSPVFGLQVRANQELVVRAVDPVTKAFDEVRISVPENTTRKITLYPRSGTRRDTSSVQGSGHGSGHGSPQGSGASQKQ